MRLKLEINPNLAALMQAEIAAGEKAVTTAMRAAGAGLKSAWRGQITGAGLGTRLGNSIRLANYPKGGESLNAAALVWSNAPVIVGAHDTGPLIRSRNGFWLAIPTPAAGKSTRGGRITTPHGTAIAVRLSPPGPKPARGGGAVEQQGARGGVAREDRPRADHGADLPAGAAGQAAQAAGSGKGCRAGHRRRAGADRGRVGATTIKLKEPECINAGPTALRSICWMSTILLPIAPCYRDQPGAHNQ